MTWTATISGHVDSGDVESIKQAEQKVREEFERFQAKVRSFAGAGVEYATFHESHGTTPEAPNQTHLAPPPEALPSDQLAAPPPPPATRIDDVAPSEDIGPAPVTDESNVTKAKR